MQLNIPEVDRDQYNPKIDAISAQDYSLRIA